MALFIAFMYDKKYAPSTVSSYVSALGYSHRFLGLADPTKAFFIIQILKGYGKIGSRLDAVYLSPFQCLTELLSHRPSLL